VSPAPVLLRPVNLREALQPARRLPCPARKQSGGLIMSDSGSRNAGGDAWRNDAGGQPHAFDPWLSISFLTPLIVLVGLFNGRRRLLHDVILGTVVINSSVRSHVGQPARTF